MAEPIDWEQVFVRHVLPDRRDDVGRIATLLRGPITEGTWGVCEEHRDLSILGRRRGPWMIALRFSGQSWIPLCTSTVAGKEMFDANAGSRRLEVAWVGLESSGSGPFFRLYSGGQPVVEFTGRVATTPGSIESDDDASLREFHGLCSRFEIPLPVPQIRWKNRAYEFFGEGSQKAITTLQGYACFG